MIKQLYKSTLVPGAENTPIYPVTKIEAIGNLLEILNNNSALLLAALETLQTIQNKVNTLESKLNKQLSIYSISNDRYPIIRDGYTANPVFKLSPTYGVLILNPESSVSALRAYYSEDYSEVTELSAAGKTEGGKITLRNSTTDHESNPFVEITTPDDWHLNISPWRVSLGGDFSLLIDEDDRARISLDNDNGGNIALYENEIELALSDPRIVIKQDGDLTLKNPLNNNLLISDLRRMILYHPNGNQFIHSNPEKVTKNGEEADDWFTIKYPNGQDLFRSNSDLLAILGVDGGYLSYQFQDEDGRSILEASRKYGTDEGDMQLMWTPTSNILVYGNYYPNDEESDFYMQYPTGQCLIEAWLGADDAWFNLYTYKGDSIIYSEYTPFEDHDNYNIREKRTTSFYNSGNTITEDIYYEYDDKQDSYYDVFRKYINFPNGNTFIEAVQNEPNNEHYIRFYYPNGTTLFAKEGTPEESEDVQLITKGEVKKNLQVYSFSLFTVPTTNAVSVTPYANTLISKNWETEHFIVPELGILTIHADFMAIDSGSGSSDIVCYVNLNGLQKRMVKGLKVDTSATTVRLSFQEILEVNLGDIIDLQLRSYTQPLNIDVGSRVLCKIEKY